MVDRVLGLSLTALFLFTHMGTQRKCINKADGDRHVGEEKSFLLDCADSCRENMPLKLPASGAASREDDVSHI